MTTDAVGGVFTYSVELARALSRRGVETVLAVLGSPSVAQRAQLAALPGVQPFQADFRLEWMEDPWRDVERAGDWLLELAARLSPDLVHLNGYAHGALPWKVPVVVVGHSCVLTWWEAVHREPAPPSWARYREAVAAGLAAADLVVTPTRAMLDGLRRHYGPIPFAEVVPNGRSAAGFRPAAVKEPFVLAAGRLWDEAKNLAALDRVAPSLPWPVYVAGETLHPEGGPAPVRHAQPLGFLPPRGLADWLGRASVYALPARYEPFGLSALEAGLSGCALVLGDLPSLREVWGEAALYVDPFSDRQLAAALRAVLADPALRASLSAAACQRARAFPSEAMADATLRAYARAPRAARA